jgi:hypothetical protein
MFAKLMNELVNKWKIYGDGNYPFCYVTEWCWCELSRQAETEVRDELETNMPEEVSKMIPRITK